MSSKDPEQADEAGSMIGGSVIDVEKGSTPDQTTRHVDGSPRVVSNIRRAATQWLHYKSRRSELESSQPFPTPPVPTVVADIPVVPDSVLPTKNVATTPQVPDTPQPPVHQSIPVVQAPEKDLGGYISRPVDDVPRDINDYKAFWTEYNRDAGEHDKDVVESLGNDLDTLFIFAGLFSGSNVAFIIESYRGLQEDSASVTNKLLRRLIHNQENPGTPFVSDTPDFSITPRAVRVNSLFFASLSCALFTAFGAVLGKQWLNHYKRQRSGITPAQRGRERQMRFMGMARWQFEHVVEMLPTLLQLSLFFFLAALIDFVWPLHRTVAGVIIAFSLISFLFYLITTFIAAAVPSSPFQTRFSVPLRWLGSFLITFLVTFVIIAKQVKVSIISAYTAIRSISLRRPSPAHINGKVFLWLGRLRGAVEHIVSYLRSSPIIFARIISRYRSGFNGADAGATEESVKKWEPGAFRRWWKIQIDSRIKGDGAGAGIGLAAEARINAECISWMLENSTIDTTISLASIAALMLPEDAWKDIQFMKNPVQVLQMVLRPRSVESEIVMGVSINNLRAVLAPLRRLLNGWDPEKDTVVPSFSNNDAFNRSFENLLWNVMRFNLDDQTTASGAMQIIHILGFREVPEQFNFDRLYGLAIQNMTKAMAPTTKLGSDEDDAILWFRLLLGAMVVLHEPIEESHLLALLAVSRFQWFGNFSVISDPLRGLIVPSKVDDTGIVGFFHPPSARAYFTDRGRCADLRFLIDTNQTHWLLAFTSLRQLNNNLTCNILGLANPLIPNQSIEDLPQKIKDKISPQLRYACGHWGKHLGALGRSTGGEGDLASWLRGGVIDLKGAVELFCKEKILPWLETSSLVGLLGNVSENARGAESWLNNSGASGNFSSLLNDTSRLVAMAEETIRFSGGSVWSVALPLAYPSALHEAYCENLGESVLKVQFRGKINDWSICLRVLHGHTDIVSDIDQLSHDRRIMSCSRDKSIRIWDMHTGTHSMTLKGHTEMVNCTIPTPDGRTILSSGDDFTIRSWDALTGEPLAIMRGDMKYVDEISLSADGKYVVAATSNHGLSKIQLWDMAKSSLIADWEGHTDVVNCVAFSSDSRYIISGSWDKTARVWDAVDRSLLYTLKGHTESVMSVAVYIRAGGLLAASGSMDHTVKLWEAGTERMLHNLEGHTDGVNHVIFSSNGEMVVSGSGDSTIRLWSTSDGSVISVLHGHTDSVSRIRFTHDEKYLLSCSDDKTARIWDGTLFLLDSTPHPISCLAISPDQKIIATSSSDNAIRLWDSVTGSLFHPPMKGDAEETDVIVFYPDGRYLVSGGGKGGVIIWDTVLGCVAAAFAEIGRDDAVHAVGVSPDGSRIAVGFGNNHLGLWNAITREHMATSDEHPTWINGIAFSPDSHSLISGSHDATVKIWDANSLSHIRTVPRINTTLCLKHLAYSPDGASILAQSVGGEIIAIWDSETFEMLISPVVTKAGVVSKELGPRLAEGDFTLRLEENWLVRQTWKGSRERMCYIPISNITASATNGCMLAIGTSDGRLTVLDLTSLLLSGEKVAASESGPSSQLQNAG